MFVLSNSCLEEDRVWSPQVVVTMDEFWKSSTSFALCASSPMLPARLRGVIHSLTLRQRWALSLRYRILSCGHCSRCPVSPLTARFAPACFLFLTDDMAGRMDRGASDSELADYVRSVVDQKEARHQALVKQDLSKPRAAHGPYWRLIRLPRR